MAETKPKKVLDLSLFRRVMSYARPYKKQFYMAIIFSILLALFTPVRPYLIKLTVDRLKTGDTESAADQLVHFVVWITAFQIFFLLLETGIRFYFSYITSWLGQSVVKDLRNNTYKKIIGLNLRQFDQTPIGTLTTRTINDIEAINQIFSDGFIPIIADMLSILSILGFMLVVDWRLTLVCLAPFPILIIATYYFKESVNKSFIKVRNAVAALNAFAQEHLTGMNIVQSFAAENREYGKFRAINRDHRNANVKAIFAYSVFFPIVEIILALSVGLLVWWIARRASFTPDYTNELVGNMMMFYLCLNLLFRPLRVIADKFNVVQMGMVASERVFKVLDNPDVTVDNGTYAPETIKGKIEFDHVYFRYVEGNDVLKDISFHAEPGETIAIVGHTGSGKTTITSLLNRFYTIQKGSIKIDGHRIEEYKLDVLRRNVGVVLQDVFLFSGTVMDNITLRDPNITKDKVEEAARLIDLHDFIETLPGGYDYKVMERGATLSLGQRQLLSFIRALLYNPSVLILDEATSSVDTESEQLIQHAIDKLVARRTSIIIAHRLSTIRKADRIIVLDKGEIREMGSHDELLAKDGFYRKLYKMQFELKESV